MTGVLVFAALATTTAGLLVLRAGDAKRRRAFGLGGQDRATGRWLARTAVWGPGIALVAVGDVAGAVIWMGGATVIGWGVAALTPEMVVALQARTAEARVRARTGWRQAADRVATVARRLRVAVGSQDAAAERYEARLARLERRVAELEAMLRERDRQIRDQTPGAVSSRVPLAGDTAICERPSGQAPAPVAERGRPIPGAAASVSDRAS